MDHTFVSADQLKTLEQFGASLLSAMISLKTLEQFQFSAYSKGLLNDDEEEVSKTICWEIKRLNALYNKLLEFIMERSQLNEDQVIAHLQSLMPAVKVPRKRKAKQDEVVNS